MPVIMVAAFGLVLCLGAVGWKLWWNQPSPSEDSPAVATQPPARAAQPKRLAPTRSSAEASPPPALASQAAVPPATAVVAPPPLPALVVTEPLDTAMSSLVTGLLLPAGTNALVSWPAPSTGFVLQENPDVANTNGWSNYGGVISSNISNLSITVPANVGNRFFRLLK